MEEVTTILPMVDTMVADNNGVDVVFCDNGIASLSVEEAKEQIDGDDVTANCQALSAESITPVSRSASSRTARRKRGAFGLFRAVYLSFSGSHSLKKRDDAAESPKKKAGADDDVDGKPPATAASWKCIVDGMRPLRLPGQDLEYYPPPPPPPGHVDVYHDVLIAPPSPFPSPMRAGAERGMTSRYASAQDLHLLDCGEQEVDDEAGLAADGGSCPHAIDMQAEEFIAKFYEQFRLQNSESVNGRATE
ncbi:hypothetical protein EJB05_30592, partial [Eragrostis curvula]